MKIMRSCPAIDNMHLNFYGSIHESNICMSLCCEGGYSFQRPGTHLKETAEETLKAFLESHKRLSEGLVDGGCTECDRYVLSAHEVNRKISRVNFSMYPAPCQCNCTYCLVPKRWVESEKVHKAYEQVFDVIEKAEHQGLIRKDASWTVASGEITIHPYKEKILEVTKGKRVSFHTNMLLFDEMIAAELNNNLEAYINFSIDAGTSKTWRAVKRVGTFADVIDNLDKYSKAARSSRQLIIKYIILPGLNDADDDYDSLISIMNREKISHLIISRDLAGKYEEGKAQKKNN